MSFLGRLGRRDAAPVPASDVAAPRDGQPAAKVPCFRSTARSHVGKVRALNEDRYVDMPEAALWAIADGMGGHSAGDVAAELVASAIRACAAYGPASVEAIAEAVQRANAELVEISDSKGGFDISGSTVVALTIDGDRYQCLWAGDSRAYLHRAGRCQRISRDHSLVQELVDSGMLAAADAQSHPKAHIITRAVGVAPKVQVDISHGRMEKGDILLLCSDGLSDLIGADRMEECLSGESIDKAADALLDAALEAGAPDNITLILVESC